MPFDKKIAQNLLPKAVVDDVSQQLLGAFLSAYGDEAFVLVELSNQPDELQAGLFASVQEDSGGSGRGPDGLGYHTQGMVSGRSGEGKPASLPPSADPMVVESLREKVRDKSHFIVPLRKREPGGTYTARITVGRARNMDIVLRHSSVSKFHGWFEKDKNTKAFCATDAGSKNGTTVNGQPVGIRKLVALAPGDVVRFGSVTLRYCGAESLGRLIKGE